jgi:hypothetical protein
MAGGSGASVGVRSNGALATTAGEQFEHHRSQEQQPSLACVKHGHQRAISGPHMPSPKFSAVEGAAHPTGSRIFITPRGGPDRSVLIRTPAIPDACQEQQQHLHQGKLSLTADPA